MSLNAESLSNHAKTVFLARLAHVLTVYARDTYEVGTERVLQPEMLRAYNELLHRVTAAVREHLLAENGYSVETIVELVRDFGAKHNRSSAMNQAIEFASKELTA